LIDEERAAPAHGLGSDSALLGEQPEADETLGQLAVGLFSDELIARVSTPEINAANLEELARGAAKKLDQRGGTGAFRGLGGDPQEEFLKSIVGSKQGAAFWRRRRHRIGFGHLHSVLSFRHRFFMILTSD
jgi:hypothetical protein